LRLWKLRLWKGGVVVAHLGAVVEAGEGVGVRRAWAKWRRLRGA